MSHPPHRCRCGVLNKQMNAYRTIRRSEWKSLKQTEYREQPFEFMGLSGIAGLVYMQEADSFTAGGVQITGSGYSWLQLAFSEEPVWATVMFDPNGTLFQCYFDITNGNVLEGGGSSHFCDLYLDAVYTPAKKEYTVLDEDELACALSEGLITLSQAQCAKAALAWLGGFMQSNAEGFCTFCISLRQSMLLNLEAI